MKVASSEALSSRQYIRSSNGQPHACAHISTAAPTPSYPAPCLKNLTSCNATGASTAAARVLFLQSSIRVDRHVIQILVRISVPYRVLLGKTCCPQPGSLASATCIAALMLQSERTQESCLLPRPGCNRGCCCGVVSSCHTLEAVSRMGTYAQLVMSSSLEGSRSDPQVAYSSTAYRALLLNCCCYGVYTTVVV